MPCSAWRGTEQMYGNRPFFLKMTLTVADLPGWISGVALPSDVNTRLWATAPLFTTLKSTVEPCGTLALEKVNVNSLATTLILTGRAALCVGAAAAGPAIARTATV